jgi:hypothetical protein
MTQTKEQIEMTQELAKSLWDYDPNTGLLFWKVKAAKKTHIGACACTEHKRAVYTTYYKVTYNYRNYLAHRIVWLMLFGELPESIDHKDGNGLNNREDNLRKATKAENQWNRGKARTNTTGYKNVVFIEYEGKLGWAYAVQMRVEKKRVTKLFSRAKFAAKEKALAAAIVWRDEQISRWHKEFANMT